MRVGSRRHQSVKCSLAARRAPVLQPRPGGLGEGGLLNLGHPERHRGTRSDDFLGCYVARWNHLTSRNFEKHITTTYMCRVRCAHSHVESSVVSETTNRFGGMLPKVQIGPPSSREQCTPSDHAASSANRTLVGPA